jgi:hypothetical protein
MKKAFGFALLALTLAAPAASASLGEIEVYDRTAGRTLEVYWHEGRRFVAGEPGHEYQVVLRNNSNRRVLAVTSVDGVNVVTGESAAPEQSGYVLSPWDSLEVSGWRKSMDEVAAFYFTPHRNSYAARTGRPFDVGVIGVALFREKGRWRRFFDRLDRDLEQDSLDDNGDAAGVPRAEEPESRSARPQEKLGTGHGRRERDEVRYTEFVRASESPDEILTIYYDSRRNLVAQGVIPRDRDVAQRQPQPFPGGFVPDP